jgi:hypothetical protein
VLKYILLHYVIIEENTRGMPCLNITNTPLSSHTQNTASQFIGAGPFAVSNEMMVCSEKGKNNTNKLHGQNVKFSDTLPCATYNLHCFNISQCV